MIILKAWQKPATEQFLRLPSYWRPDMPGVPPTENGGVAGVGLLALPVPAHSGTAAADWPRSPSVRQTTVCRVPVTPHISWYRHLHFVSTRNLPHKTVSQMKRKGHLQ
jgi:hypothetical protein